MRPECLCPAVIPALLWYSPVYRLMCRLEPEDRFPARPAADLN
jgi:hypothetical protein